MTYVTLVFPLFSNKFRAEHVDEISDHSRNFFWKVQKESGVGEKISLF